MKFRWTWLMLVMIAMVALWGCSDDDDNGGTEPTATPFETLAAAGAAYINDSADCPGVIAAGDLNAALDDYTVIDVRREADYLAGHIPGAYHSTLGDLLDKVGTEIPVTTGDDIVVVCYSGQSAGHAKIALELMGYESVKSLKFGMCDWNTANSGSWDNNSGSANGNNLGTIETDNNNGDLTTHTLPDLDGYTNATVVAERVDEMLAAGFKGISYSAMVAAGIDDYFILNYWTPEQYDGTSDDTPGHIPGAFQFTPYSSLGIDQMLDNLPSDGTPIVVYCWTGQHSSQVTAYLNMLGYNAFSLTFGANNLFWDQLGSHKWEGTTNTFPLETGSRPTAAFAAMAEAGAEYINDSLDCPGVISASDLHTALVNDNDAYTVIDIRAADDYASATGGHIPGAYNSSLATLLDDIGTTIPVTTSDAIVVACYSGQSAGHAKIALELLGYENVKSLKFGMSDWHTSLSGSWDNNTADNLGTIETDDQNENLDWYAFPTLDGYTAANVVEARVAAMLAGGFKAISYTEMVTNGIDDYFIVNYWTEDQYDGTDPNTPGHIPGAFQFTPYSSLGWDEMLANLPSDGEKTIVVYCWTGQHSSQVTAYLNMLGYTALSLRFGSNNLFHSQLGSHQWPGSTGVSGTANAFPLVTGEDPGTW